MGSCAHASAGHQKRRFALSGWGEGGDGGGWGDLAGGENAGLGGVERGDVDDAAGTPGEGDGVDAAELDRDPPPRQVGGPFGDPDQQQGEPAQQDVGADPRFQMVMNRPEFEGGLQVAEAAFG